MNPVDIIILIILGLGAFEGFRQGFLMSVVGLIAFAVGIVLGFYFMDPMTDWLADNVTTFNLAYPSIAFLIIFLISFLIIRAIGWILKQVMHLILLGAIDSFAGAILGVVKAGFFISLFIWLANQFDLELPKKWEQESEIITYIQPLAPAVVNAIEPFFPNVEVTLKKLQELVEELKHVTVD